MIWRGPMLHKMLEQFVNDVFWDRPDMLVVDMPPGTGDISLSLSRLLPDAEVVDRDDAPAGGPAGRPASRLHGPSGQPAGRRRHREHELVHRQRRRALRAVRRRRRSAAGRAQLEVPLLGQVPLVPALRDGADRGEPVVVSDPAGIAAQALDAIASRLLTLGTDAGALARRCGSLDRGDALASGAESPPSTAATLAPDPRWPATPGAAHAPSGPGHTTGSGLGHGAVGSGPSSSARQRKMAASSRRTAADGMTPSSAHRPVLDRPSTLSVRRDRPDRADPQGQNGFAQAGAGWAPRTSGRAGRRCARRRRTSPPRP